jgi:hypothetical protein
MVSALWIVSYPRVHHAAPLQKMFVVPLAECLWAVLALMPFIDAGKNFPKDGDRAPWHDTMIEFGYDPRK